MVDDADPALLSSDLMFFVGCLTIGCGLMLGEPGCPSKMAVERPRYCPILALAKGMRWLTLHTTCTVKSSQVDDKKPVRLIQVVKS